MTVSTLEAGVLRTGNGVTTVFSFSFEARFEDDITVEIVDGQIVTAVDPTEYSVSINSGGVGGSVTFGVAPANGVVLYISRSTSFDQLVSVSSQQRYDPEVVENVWDKLTFQTQELAASIERALKVAPGTSSTELLETIFDAEAAALAASAEASALAAEASAASASAAAAAAAALAAENSLLRWVGTWVTATAYTPSDIVFNAGSSYICVIAHTSAGAFATDLGANRWALLAQQGSSGAGTGDMLNADNLAGLVDAAASRANLGLGALAVENDITFALMDASALATSAGGGIDAYDTDDTRIPTAKAVAEAIAAIGAANDYFTKGWQTVTRDVSVEYENTNAYPLDCMAYFDSGTDQEFFIDIGAVSGALTTRIYQGIYNRNRVAAATFTVPPGWFYKWRRTSTGVTCSRWSERSL